ncbi:hypothetical protein GQ600_10005 [Phytophthora cactorum]|jgi:hypothetical protein
MGMS